MDKLSSSSFLFALRNTVQYLPYLLFMIVSLTTDVSDLDKILPFILYYCVKSSGIYLLKPLHTKNNTYRILKISLLLGLIACILGMFGDVQHIFYEISAVLLGLCESFYIPSYISMLQYERSHDRQMQNKYEKLLGTILILIFFVLCFTMMKAPNFIIFVYFSFLFLIPLLSISKYKSYKLEDHEYLSNVMYSKELSVFVVMLLLIIGLRVARSFYIGDIFIIALVILCLILLIISLFLYFKKPQLTLTFKMIYKILFVGAAINLVIYTGMLTAIVTYHSIEAIVLMYACYVIGSVLSEYYTIPFVNWLKGDKVNKVITLCLFGILLLNFPVLTGISMIATTFMLFTLSKMSETTVYKHDGVPKDVRMVAKYKVQTFGGVIMQFIFTFTLLLIAHYNHESINGILEGISLSNLNFNMFETTISSKAVASVVLIIFGLTLIAYNKKTKSL
ncbi:hypothetical protein [Mycoplasma sp. P36-A1]|uniref:hypothetical protein n=1 Tax=Mycoplasma sp. P36-A1 TaxID=3252900 RepID=UPI003C2BAC9D